MAASKFLISYAKLLQEYSGRDKVMRTLSYMSLLLSGISKSDATSKKLLTIFSQLSQCRTILRLFDDVPMLAYSLSYGLGQRETSSLMQVLGVLKNLVDQAFFPLEHIAWAADQKLISVESRSWWILSLAAWLVSLAIGIIKNGLHLMAIQSQRKHALKETKSMQDGNLQYARDLTLQQAAVAMTMLADACDLCNAIHWMPAGFLWSQQLSSRWVGMFGTISSLIKLGQIVQRSR